MRLVSTLALGLMLAAGTAVAVAPAQAAKKKEEAAAAGGAPKVKLGKAFVEAYNVGLPLLNANDFPGAKAQYAAIKAAAQSDDEKYQAAVYGMQLGARAKDRALQYEASQMFVASATTPAAEKLKYQFIGGVLNPDPAAGLQQQVAAYNGGYRDDSVALNISDAYYKNRDAVQGAAWAQKQVDDMTAAGKPVPADYYAITLNNAIRANDRPGQVKWSQALLSNSLIPDHWRVGIDVAVRNNPAADNQVALDLYRLQRKANAMGNSRDYQSYVEAADPVRLPGEVIRVIGEGKANRSLTGSEPWVSDALSRAQGRVAADKASLSSAERDGQAGRDGKVASGSGDALMGHGEWQRAVTLYETALTKGGVDAGRVNTRIGIAKYELGDAAGAKAAFEKVTSGPWATDAKYWLMYLAAKAKGAPTTAPVA